MISYLQFRETMHPYGCFNVQQVKIAFPDFDRTNYTRWVKQGLLLRLRQEWYAFPDMLKEADFARFIAERIYRPSYISLHSALSFYGMIPESVMRITSVSTMKTVSFENEFGQYSYQSVRPSCFFGYEPRQTMGGRSFMLAHPEKALLDLLYLYPQYNTEEDIEELRLDEDYMTSELNYDRLDEYQHRIGNKALDARVKQLRLYFDI